MIEFIKKITVLSNEQEKAINQVIKSSLVLKGDIGCNSNCRISAPKWTKPIHRASKIRALL
jgi:hypothetical protein